jgi:hypothetical protein
MALFGDLSVGTGAPGALKHALNRSGWLDDEVVAAGQLRQGKAPTMAGMVTGTALVELARPRRSKALPRHFVLAVTADRVVAFKALAGAADETGPYVVRIHRGEQGSWPRGTVRLVDLPEGAQSKGATLQIAGADGVPVSRPNLDGDPDTDELLELLGQLAPARPGSRRTAAGDPRDLAADAERGRPATDLRGWAGRRGLSFRDGSAQAGYLGVTCPWSEDLLFNVVRGTWPGGSHGVLCHEVRLYEAQEGRYFHGGKAIGRDRGGLAELAGDLAGLPLITGGGAGYLKVPYTAAGLRVPHLATVSGLRVARRDERRPLTSGTVGLWREQQIDDVWVADVRKHSDEATVARLLSGPVRELLGVDQGLGFELRIEYGQVVVSRQDFLMDDADLDALVASAEAFGRAVGELCVLRAPGCSLADRLPAPAWLEPVRSRPREAHTLWPIGARLEQVVEIADERGLTVEDPRAFHAAFGALNVPGEAFGVLNGRLPGTQLTGRLLCCAERRMDLPDDLRALLKDPGGAVGCDVAVVAVDPGATPTAPEGEREDGLRVAIADGVLTAWRLRPRWQADGEALDRLAREVAGAVARRGL